ncbi:LPS assembly lipoprotein LptE [Thalassospiraceae bacterium LMO-JJ14]|nr:LPS assembly lipoprotein LptE [Thalassospiraceae bacterium LMO-JJ14]
MSLFRPVLAAALVLALGGCGFRPLYVPPQEDVSRRSAYAFDIFKKVSIGNIPDREGQYFRNQLVQLLHPAGHGTETDYFLEVTLTESTRDLAVQKSAIATRANLTVRANFTLRHPGNDEAAYSGVVTTSSGYNIFQSEFQTLMAEKGARERGLNDLAQQLRIRLAALLTRAEPQTAKP